MGFCPQHVCRSLSPDEYPLLRSRALRPESLPGGGQLGLAFFMSAKSQNLLLGESRMAWEWLSGELSHRIWWLRAQIE